MKLTVFLLSLFAAGQASAHASHAHAVAHNIEHLLLLSLLLAPALLLVRPLKRLLATRGEK